MSWAARRRLRVLCGSRWMRSWQVRERAGSHRATQYGDLFCAPWPYVSHSSSVCWWCATEGVSLFHNHPTVQAEQELALIEIAEVGWL